MWIIYNFDLISETITNNPNFFLNLWNFKKYIFFLIINFIVFDKPFKTGCIRDSFEHKKEERLSWDVNKFSINFSEKYSCWLRKKIN